MTTPTSSSPRQEHLSMFVSIALSVTAMVLARGYGMLHWSCVFGPASARSVSEQAVTGLDFLEAYRLLPILAAILIYGPLRAGTPRWLAVLAIAALAPALAMAFMVT